jgi:hypothetical protein
LAPTKGQDLGLPPTRQSRETNHRLESFRQLGDDCVQVCFLKEPLSDVPEGVGIFGA